MKRIEMNFLPDVYVMCDVCRGARYNRETISVKYKGKSIAGLLDATVEEALPLLENIPQIKQKLQTLLDVVWVISSWANPRRRFRVAKRSALSSPRSCQNARPGAPFIFLTSRPPAFTLRTCTSFWTSCNDWLRWAIQCW